MTKKDNLQLWNSVEKTNPKHTKQVKKGALTLTAINAQHQMYSATEQWGKYGEKWGLKDIKLDYINGLSNNQIMCVAQAVFFYPCGSFEIGSSILVQSWIASKSYNKVDDDFLKKLETDMMTKSLSKLGFNADIFMGRYDDNRYIAQVTQEFAQVNNPPKPKQAITDERFAKALDAMKVGKTTKDYILNNFVLTDTQKKQL